MSATTPTWRSWPRCAAVACGGAMRDPTGRWLLREKEAFLASAACCSSFTKLRRQTLVRPINGKQRIQNTRPTHTHTLYNKTVQYVDPEVAMPPELTEFLSLFERGTPKDLKRLEAARARVGFKRGADGRVALLSGGEEFQVKADMGAAGYLLLRWAVLVCAYAGCGVCVCAWLCVWEVRVGRCGSAARRRAKKHTNHHPPPRTTHHLNTSAPPPKLCAHKQNKTKQNNQTATRAATATTCRPTPRGACSRSTCPTTCSSRSSSRAASGRTPWSRSRSWRRPRVRRAGRRMGARGKRQGASGLGLGLGGLTSASLCDRKRGRRYPRSTPVQHFLAPWPSLTTSPNRQL